MEGSTEEGRKAREGRGGGQHDKRASLLLRLELDCERNSMERKRRLTEGDR